VSVASVSQKEVAQEFLVQEQQRLRRPSLFCRQRDSPAPPSFVFKSQSRSFLPADETVFVRFATSAIWSFAGTTRQT
jgi:hypothetical protein